MTDDDPPFVPPPLPQDFVIPDALVNAWVGLAPDHPLTAPVTRRDVDRLYFSLQRIIAAQASFQNAMIAYTNGNLGEANRLTDLARRETIEASNYSKQFLAELMAANAFDKNNAGG